MTPTITITLDCQPLSAFHAQLQSELEAARMQNEDGEKRFARLMKIRRYLAARADRDSVIKRIKRALADFV